MKPNNVSNYKPHYLINCLRMMIRSHSWTKAAEGKTLFSPRHPLNAFSEPRPSRKLELLEGLTTNFGGTCDAPRKVWQRRKRLPIVDDLVELVKKTRIAHPEI